MVQHFKPIDIFGGKTAFEELKKEMRLKQIIVSKIILNFYV